MDPKREGPENSADLSRRRVIKAAAGAPVLLTLASGAARANTSAFQCIANGANSAPHDPVEQPRGTGNPNPDWVWNPPQYYQVEDPPGSGNMVDMERWTLRRFVDDGSGNVTETPSGDPVTVSCYASFG